MDTIPISPPPLPSDPSIPSPQIVPPPPTVHHPSKLLWFLAGLTILILGILAGYFATNVLSQSKKPSDDATTPSQKSSTNFSQLAVSPTSTIDPTANWKTYTNPNYPFSFKYPSNYTVEENSGYISILSPLLPVTDKGYELKNGELKIEIYIQSSPVNDSLKKYVLEKKTQTKENLPESKIINETEVTIDGIKTILLKWEAVGTGETRYVIKNGYRIGITKYPLETSRQSEFDQILSTFTFTD
ncbi:MAG: PsbP-related protein [Candidatus Gottesmanbacteria bacterium]|nr:PsbP-related protein [Candidatus Gottesmanbacteria bacterium]